MKASVKDIVLLAFGAVLKERRKRASQTQIDLSANAVIVRDFISALETGRKEPGLRTLLKLGRGLGISSGELLSRTEHVLSPVDAKERVARDTETKISVGTETCPACKTLYTLYARRLRRRERGKFKCAQCKTQLASWLGTTELIFERRRPPKSRQIK